MKVPASPKSGDFSSLKRAHHCLAVMMANGMFRYALRRSADAIATSTKSNASA